MSKLVISEAPLVTLPALNRLFTHAVRQHFSYFPGDQQEIVIRDHSVAKLLLAALHPRRILLVARFGGRIVGYAIGSVPAAGPGQMYWLYVDPDHRGQNTGLKLLSRMLKLQRHKGATAVVLATHDHRRYYERQGFDFVEQRQVNGVPMDILTYPLERQ